MSDAINTQDRAGFRRMADGTKEDWGRIVKQAMHFNTGLAERVLSHLKLLDGDFGGFPIDRLQHSLQTATRAHRDGKDAEYVVCCLLHDIGDTLGSYNHADIAASILQPFVSEKNYWMVKNHAIFQGYYFFDYIGLDKNLRDQFIDHPHYTYTAQFVHLYDQMAFDPDYVAEPLSFFEPMVNALFASPQRSIYMDAVNGTRVNPANKNHPDG